MLKITLMTPDDKCDLIVEFKISHMCNFTSNKNGYHFLFDEDLIKATAALIKAKIPFEVKFSVLTLDETKAYVRVDSDV